MNIIRIADTITEQIHDKPQELFDRYVESVDMVNILEFSSYCSVRVINITESQFFDLLANNNKYLFTECGDSWMPTKIDEIEELFEEKDPSYDPEHPEECCPHCGARQERGDDGICNRCGKDWPD
jgi:uncharacterized paraquat-inducible protein A